MVGLCGGFTTFSSFSLQTLDLLRGGAWMRALLNIALSVLLCLAAVAVGHALAAQLNSGARAVAQNTIEEEAS
jgi:CrcB protein